MTNYSGFYPFIGDPGSGERGGLWNAPNGADSSLFTTPTLSISALQTAISAGFAGVRPGGKAIIKVSGTQYAIPVYTTGG